MVVKSDLPVGPIFCPEVANEIWIHIVIMMSIKDIGVIRKLFNKVVKHKFFIPFIQIYSMIVYVFNTLRLQRFYAIST